MKNKEQKVRRGVSGRRICAGILVFALIGGGMGCPSRIQAADDPAAPAVQLHNPGYSGIQGGEMDPVSGIRNPRTVMRTRDVITFGSYWQEDTNGDGKADQQDEKQPIRWHVLSVEDNDVFLMSESILDCRQQGEEVTSGTWVTSALRKWLNEDFYRTAFTAEEQKAVRETTVVNEDNPEYETDGGVNTKDKVYLLSLQEVTSERYGFNELHGSDETRLCTATPYAAGKGLESDADGKEYYSWWLRSPGSSDMDAAYVSGDVWFGGSMFISEYGVRPVLHLDLSVFQPDKVMRAETALAKSEWDVVELGMWNQRPMKWRVLSAREGDVFLLSDRVIGERQYHGQLTDVTWETSALRKWLNEEFYKNTFSDMEKKGIRNATWENPDNLVYGTEGGNATNDFVSILSLQDIAKKEYGFPIKFYCNHPSRAGYKANTVEDCWWLRSPGSSKNTAAFTSNMGAVIIHGGELGEVSTKNQVRPALHFDHTAQSLRTAGVISTEDELESIPDPPAGNEGNDKKDPPKKDEPDPGNKDQDKTEKDVIKKKKKPAVKPGKVSSFKVKNRKKRSVECTWKKAKKTKKYQLQYSLNKKFKKAKTKSTSKRRYIINKLKKKKTYYFRIRAVSSTGHKSAWSRRIKVKIKK